MMYHSESKTDIKKRAPPDRTCKRQAAIKAKGFDNRPPHLEVHSTQRNTRYVYQEYLLSFITMIAHDKVYICSVLFCPDTRAAYNIVSLAGNPLQNGPVSDV